MPTILGIESTCDETAAALVADGWDVRCNVVATQVDLHAKYRGVVPEIASRAHIENILPVLREAIGWGDACVARAGAVGATPASPVPGSIDASGEAGLAPTSDRATQASPLCIDAVAVAHRPGLIGSLLIGVTAAKTLAWALGKPLIGVDHVHAHLYSVVLGERSEVRGQSSGMAETCERSEVRSQRSGKTDTSVLGDEPRAPTPPFPAVGLVISGGHTSLYRVNSWLDVTLIGSTIDDAVGEAYDKVAAILGLGYPGGPIIDTLAAQGDPNAVKFPRTLLGRDSLDFSFSGLKTAVLYHVRGVPTKHGPDVRKIHEPPPTGQTLADLGASFQAACIEVIVKKLQRAARQIRAKSVIIGGGVSANRGLRAALANFSIPVFFPAMQYCTDNAAMSAGLAHVYFQEGRFSDLGLDAVTYSQFR